MSDDRKTRVREQLKVLEGIDAGERIRGMGKELYQSWVEGARRHEIDGPERTTDILDVDVMAFEDKNGFWRVETLSDSAFPGARGGFSATDRSERLALAEFRMELASQMVTSRFCRREQATLAAAKARITVQGRVPFARIIVGA
jgi:hypothetical protein